MDAKRECGDCTLCCKLMAVKELKKPANKWCDLVQIGKGCGDYENRPQSCHGFECMWLQGVLPEELKPNKVHWLGWEAEKTIQLHVDQHYSNVKDTKWFKDIIDFVMERGYRLIVVEGNQRKLYASSMDQIPEVVRGKLNGQ